jgi:sugar/nucleoside kinase (ribokinase family)
MRSAVVAGHLCVDLIPQLDQAPDAEPGQLTSVGPLRLQPGGCVANTGGDLAALGAAVTVVGDAGDDELGATLVRMLAARGLPTDRIRLVPGRSTSYSIVVQPPGADRSFWHHVGANAHFDGSSLEFSGAALLHVGYPPLLPALYAAGGAALERLLVRARAAGLTTSLDLAVLDPLSEATREDWPALLDRVLPLVDVLTPSVDDVRSLLGWKVAGDLDAVRRTAARLADLGPAVVLLTAGAAGLVLRTADPERLAAAGEVFDGDPRRQAEWSRQDRAVTALPVPVRTTVGTGDAATAGLLYGLLADLGPADSLRLAARAAAVRVGGGRLRPGAPLE